MQVVPEDILDGVSATWQTSDMPNLVPGSLTYGRAPTGTNMPYGVVKLTEGAREEFSGGHYLQHFEVEIAIYSNLVPSNTDVIRRQLAQTFDFTPNMAVPNSDSLIHCKPLPGGLKLHEQQKDANDVLVASGKWDVLIQATRVSQ